MGFELRFSDKEITAWGGMGIMKRMLDHLGFEAALTVAGLPQPGSNRGYRPEQLITQFLLSVWCGANRFEHGEVTRHDPVLLTSRQYRRQKVLRKMTERVEACAEFLRVVLRSSRADFRPCARGAELFRYA